MVLNPEETNLSSAQRLFLKCRHFTQIDPDPQKNPPERVKELLDIIRNSKPATDAIIVAGSQNVNAQNILDCIDGALNMEFPVYAAPSSPKQISKNLLDVVLGESVTLLLYHAINAQNPKYITKPHAEFEAMLHQAGINLDAHRVDIGYIVLNRKSAVGVLTKPDLHKRRLMGYAISAAREYPVIYLEGSGRQVDEDILGKVSDAFIEKSEQAYLLVGGGICCSKSAERALKYADGIVVGKVLEDKNYDGYQETIRAAKKLDK